MLPPDHLILPEAPLGVLVWRLGPGMTALSSAVVGGGLSWPGWIVNLRVPSGYGRTDIEAHIGEVTTAAALNGEGVGLLTAAGVERFGVGEERGLRVDATAGVSHPTWAAAPTDTATGDTATGDGPGAGTVNIVARLPVPLEGAAAVNAVSTMTEAKTQALLERGIDGTGTPTDAVVVVWPTAGGDPVRFCGPRAPWGAALARATHEAVGAAIDRAH